MEHFVAGTTARCAAALVGINFKSSAYYYRRLREIICLATEDEMPFSGEIEVDESYFGGRRKGKRGRGAVGKVPVFGLLKCGGKVYTKIIPDSLVYSDCWRGYNVLDVSEFKYFQINHFKLFADKGNHINGGVPKEYFGLYLKECEWHFNNPKPQAQLKELKQWVKEYMG